MVSIMANPKGNPNIAEYGKLTRFGTAGRGCSAVDAGELGNKSQAATRALMAKIADKVDPEKAAEAFTEELENGNMTAWRIWFEFNVQKPAQQVEADITQNVIRVTLDD